MTISKMFNDKNSIWIRITKRSFYLAIEIGLTRYGLESYWGKLRLVEGKRNKFARCYIIKWHSASTSNIEARYIFDKEVSINTFA